MRKLFFVLLLVFLFPGLSFADDSVDVSKFYRGNSPYVWVIVTLTADASGNIADDATMTEGAGNTVTTDGFTLPQGFMLGCKAIPPTGDTQPTDNYDLYLRDSNDFDYFFGEGVDLAQSVTDAGNIFTPLTNSGTYAPMIGDKLFFNASGMGADNVTVLRCYFMESKPH